MVDLNCFSCLVADTASMVMLEKQLGRDFVANGDAYRQGSIPAFVLDRSGEELSKRTQIVRHVSELFQHGRVAEIARSRITRARERDCANVPLLARQRFGTHDNGHSIEAFRRLASRIAVITSDEWQRDVIGDLGHGSYPV